METEELEKRLTVGTKIKIGERCAAETFRNDPVFKVGAVITLIEGHFEYDNGLYTEDQTAPSIWDKELHEFSSIYHLFDNDLSGFLDSEIINEIPDYDYQNLRRNPWQTRK